MSHKSTSQASVNSFFRLGPIPKRFSPSSYSSCFPPEPLQHLTPPSPSLHPRTKFRHCSGLSSVSLLIQTTLMGTNLSTHSQGSLTELEANSSTPHHFPQFNISTSSDHGTVHTQPPLTQPSNSQPQPSPSHSSPQESTTSCTPLTTAQTLTSHTKHHHALHFIHTPSKLPSP